MGSSNQVNCAVVVHCAMQHRVRKGTRLLLLDDGINGRALKGYRRVVSTMTCKEWVLPHKSSCCSLEVCVC
jgi:hypothetical protein